MACDNEGQPEVFETSMKKVDKVIGDLNDDGVVDKTDKLLAKKAKKK